MSPRLLAVVVLAVTMGSSRASAQAAPAASVIGTWRGTSLCTVRPSSCNDERVVYRVTPLASHDSVSVDARKIVNGQEEAMGALRCGLDMTRRQLTCAMPNGVWRLEARADSLVGDLRLPNDTKFRDVRATRGH